MSAHGYGVVPNRVSMNPELSDGAVRLYTVLLGWKPESDDSVIATHEQLGRVCGHGRQWAVERIRELNRAGLIDWWRGGHKQPNRYLLLDVIARGRRESSGAGVEPVEQPSPERVDV